MEKVPFRYKAVCVLSLAICAAAAWLHYDCGQMVREDRAAQQDVAQRVVVEAREWNRAKAAVEFDRLSGQH